METKVKIKLFKDGGTYKDDVFVAVNGRTFQIMRGVEVEVPDYVAEVLDHARDQEQKTAEMMQKLEDSYHPHL